MPRRQEEAVLELPKRYEVVIPRWKTTGYLLAVTHPVGGPKAKYFESRGYSADAPEILEETLREVARTGRVARKEATNWGAKYLIVGEVIAPDGNPMILGTVWFVMGDASPTLVTAYPARS
jgi:filamentous hemagglutinin